MSRGSALLSDAALSVGVVEFAFLALYAVLVLRLPSHATFARLAGVVALSALTFVLHHAFFDWCSNPHWRGIAAAMFPVQLLNASDIVFITRLSSSAVPGKNVVHRAYRAVVLLFNQRRIGTVWQVKNVPPTATLTRAHFLRERLATTFVAYLALDAMVSAPAAPAALVSAEKQTLLHLGTLSAEDVMFRVVGCLFYWLSGCLVLVLVSNAIAIVLVTAGLSAPHDRPPLFGAPGEAYTVRRCWGLVWHQCLRRALTSHADFISDRVLCLRRGSLLSRYTRIGAAFLISGAVHHVCMGGMGVPSDQVRALDFFSLQALGIVAEDAAQAALAGRSCFRNRRARRLVGYVWVVTFVAWTAPLWVYPQLRTGSDPELLLPVRVARPLVGVLKGLVRG